MNQEKESNGSFSSFASRFVKGTAVGTLFSASFFYACQFFPSINDIPDSHDGVYFFGLNLVLIALIGILLPLVMGILAIFTIKQKPPVIMALGSLVFTVAGYYVSWRMLVRLYWLAWALGID